MTENVQLFKRAYGCYSVEDGLQESVTHFRDGTRRATARGREGGEAAAVVGDGGDVDGGRSQEGGEVVGQLCVGLAEELAAASEGEDGLSSVLSRTEPAVDEETVSESAADGLFDWKGHLATKQA